jgi:cyclic pyranopterin phosphate synthase
MQDGYGRNIDYLRLSVTDLCNFRCHYCMPTEGAVKRPHRDILSVEEIVEIGQAAVQCGVTKIRLTGGEPLVRHGILDICQRLSGLDRLQELCMTTNGSLLPDMAAPLRAAGVTRLNISLDTLVPEKFASITRRGTLDDVLSGIQAAEAVGFSDLKLNTVLIGGFNDNEIVDFVNLTKAHAWEVRFIELMPMGACAGWDSSCFLSDSTVLQACPELQPAGQDGVANRYRLPGAPGTVGLISPLSHSFCSCCRRIRVTPDGKLKTCLHSQDELPLRGLHGADLEAAIRRGILQKPERHYLTSSGSNTSRDMNEIGG